MKEAGRAARVIRVASGVVFVLSIAGLIITTEATITEQPKKEAPPMPGGGMGGMGGMDF